MTTTRPATTTDTTGYGELVRTLDLPAKVRLLTGGDMFTLAAEQAVGLREVALSDGPTGVRGLKFSGGRTVALFPNATLLASAWSVDTAYEVGTLLAEEAMAQQIHVVLGPTINLHRSLLGGRLFEAYSEDPLLTGKLAAGYVRGLQNSGVGACLKHLVANESETLRNTVNSIVDEVTLRELYLLPFEIAVHESRPWSIMAAYNDVNGVAATEQDHVQNEIVKGEWGFDGLIMSDWFATKTAGPAANGGLDLVMPGPGGPWGDALVQAVRAGEVAESVIDEHVERLLRLAERVGALGAERDYLADLPTPDSAARKEQLTRLAADGITVLTNVDNILPLAADSSVALIGRHALETIDMGGGSAQVNPPYQASIADGLTALLGDAVTVTDGVEVRNRSVPARISFVTDPETGEPGTHAWIYATDGTLLEHKHVSGALVLVGFDDNYPAPVGRVVMRAELAASGQIELGVVGKGSWSVRAGEHTSEFEVLSTAAGFGHDMLTPSARSELVTVNGTGIAEIELTLPAPGGGPMDNVATVGLIARLAPRDQDQVIADAATAAADADVAVVVVGLTEEQETEAVDKSTLHLTGRQDDLVRAVAAAARRTVVVVNSATPVIMPWIDRVDAVLWAGLPGQEGGHAIAAALLGHLEPAGRLVTTFPADDGLAPAWSVTPVDGNLIYREGTAIGYRGHYAGTAPPPAFWLGHGLGYSSWDYGKAELATGAAPGDVAPPRVCVSVRNIGNRRSREVVQVYYRPAEPDQPVRLVGWQSVTVDPGGTATAVITPEPRMWRRWDEPSGGWQQLSRGGEFLIARGLGDIRTSIDLP